MEQKIQRRIEAFDMMYSRFRNDSIVTRMHRSAGMYNLDEQSARLASLYRQLYQLTDGAMTPLVGEGLVAAGYDEHYSLTPRGPHTAPEWDHTITWQGNAITTKQPILIDVGAAGKGALVDAIAEILSAHGLSNYVIDASGDICHRGDDFQTIGLEHPLDATKVVGTMQVSNASLCASASNRRRWADGWHHILDGRTGKPVEDVIATWVIAGDTMTADGLATALFFVDAKKLQDVADFQFVRLFANGKSEHSPEIMGQLYI